MDQADTAARLRARRQPAASVPSPSTRMLDALYADRPARFAYGLAVLLGLLFVADLYPWAFLTGKGMYFEIPDAAQHVTGWRMFAQDGWHFPLLRTERLNFPAGVIIAFTDSIPVAALLFKTIAPWLPAGFHYIGWWHALAYVTQALGAVALIRALGCRHGLAAVVAVAFALSWPTLLHRMAHTALMTHGLLLFALALYIRGRNDEVPARAAAYGLLLLSVLGLTVHPYFLAMCYPLFLAFLAERALAGDGWLRQIVPLGVSLAVLALTGVVLGYFGHGNTVTGGFGIFSMNLLAPFCGGKIALCSPIKDDFQGEGINYLGSGLLLLLPFALVAARGQGGPLRRFSMLIAVLAGFTVYALSNHVYWGTHELLSYPLPAAFDRITGTFRASGRFFWPVGYLVLGVTLAVLLKRRSWKTVLLLACALALQWWDTAPARQLVTVLASRPPLGDLDAWPDVMRGTQRINVYPAFGCGTAEPDQYLFFQRLAARYDKLLNTGYVARANADCARESRDFDTAFRADALYALVNLEKAPFDVPAGFAAAAQRGECAALRGMVVCTPGRQVDWAALGTGAGQSAAAALQPRPATWPADALPGLVGRVADGRHTAGAGDPAGYLSYGPYVRLGAGQYRFALEYAGSGDAATALGSWDVFSQPDPAAPGTQLLSGKFTGTGDEHRSLSGTFRVGPGGTTLQVRAFHDGKGRLATGALTLEKLP